MWTSEEQHPARPHLELGELLASRASLGVDLKDVVADGLGEGAALANGDHVTLLHTEAGGDVGGYVFVALLITVVLADVVEVVATDDEGALHLVSLDNACEGCRGNVRGMHLMQVYGEKPTRCARRLKGLPWYR
jgi:hypothetical protein